MAGAITSFIQRGLRASPKKAPDAGYALAFVDQRKQGPKNVKGLRNLARSPWVRAAIDIRKGQVSAAEWDIVPHDPERPFSKRLQQKIKERLDEPNPRDESFQTMVEMLVEDILVLDAGAAEKVRNQFGFGEPVEMWPVDGGSIRVNKLWDGDDEEARYYWFPDPGLVQVGDGYKNDELMYLMQRPRTHSSVGLGTVEILAGVIEAELFGTEFNDRQIMTAGGDGIFDLGENARPDQVEKFQRHWLADIAGKGATAFWGGTRGAKWIPFRSSNHDMQFLEYMEYMVKKTAAVFEMNPQDLGLTSEVNKATAQVLDQQTEERGARRLLKLVQGSITREFVWDKAYGGRGNNLAFRFTRLNLKQSLQIAQIHEIELGKVAERAVNEIRMEQGLEPFAEDHFNYPMAQSSIGFVSLRDVPTAREMMDSKDKPEPAPDKPPAAAADSEKTLKIEVPESVGAMVAAATGEISRAMADRSPTVAEGAVQVHVEAPGAISQKGPKHTEFIYDEVGRVTGKKESFERTESGLEPSDRHTEFIYDDAGKIIGKNEFEEAE